MREINFVHKEISAKEIESLLGPITDNDEFFEFDDSDLSMASLMAKANLFPSKSQARKNGFDRDVQIGFDMFRFGKQKHLICSIRPVPSVEKESEDDSLNSEQDSQTGIE